jgi:hypothetical protein
MGGVAMRKAILSVVLAALTSVSGAQSSEEIENLCRSVSKMGDVIFLYSQHMSYAEMRPHIEASLAARSYSWFNGHSIYLLSEVALDTLGVERGREFVVQSLYQRCLEEFL